MSIVDDFMSGILIWHKGRLLNKLNKRDCMCISEGSMTCRFGIGEKTDMMMGG